MTLTLDSKDTDMGFAPADPTDGRVPGEWESRYPPAAARHIRLEATYLAVLLATSVAGLLFLWYYIDRPLLGLSAQRYCTLCRYAFAWLSGLMGGTLFSLKWLYHSTARNLWNQDRRLWRFATPHLSSALAFLCICLIRSGLFTILNPDAPQRLSVVVAVGFLTGYFSDTALAKFAEIAYTLFGTGEKHQKGKQEDEH